MQDPTRAIIKPYENLNVTLCENPVRNGIGKTTNIRIGKNLSFVPPLPYIKYTERIKRVKPDEKV